VIEARPVLWKVELPIDVTLEGIVIEDKLVQPWKRESPNILILDVGTNVIELKELQL
jgi:hypothetical protein